MKRNTFYQNTFVFYQHLHQYWMKSIDIWWKETHFIKIQICTPILDEKNTFYQNIHLYTFNIGWKETHFYQDTQFCASILDEMKNFIKYTFVSYQYWMKRNTFYQNTNLYSNIGWKEHILSKYTFVHLQHWMKGNTFLSAYTIACLQYWMKRNTFYQNTNLYSNIGWKEHILSKYTFVHHQHWMKWNTFYQNTLLYPINIGWTASILDEKHRYWMKRNTFYQNISLYTFNIGWKETHFIKIYFCIPSILDEKHQYWMKSIDIGWKETHFIKIRICTPILDEKNTFYQNIHLSTWNCMPWILDEKHQYWMKGNTFYQNTNLYSNIRWKETHLSKYKFVLQYWMKRTHFIKIYICTPSTLDEMKHILSKHTFLSYQYWMNSINIGWKASILDEKKHILSKYKFVHLQHWMKGNTFYQNTLLYSINIGWKASILDEKHRYWMKRNTFYQNTNLYSNIGWKEHILSKYTFVHLQHWMKGNTFLSKYTIAWLQYCTKRNTFYQNIFVHLHYSMKRNTFYQYNLYTFNIGWKKTHFIKIQICSPILDEKNTFHQNIQSTLDERFLKIHNCVPSILDEKKHILSKYKFVLQYWKKRTHFIKIYISTPSTLDERKHIFINTQFCAFNIGWNETFYQHTLLYPINIGWKAAILDEKKHIFIKIQFVLQYWMKRTHFIKIYICTPWILHEKNTYQNTNLYQIRYTKYTFVHLQHWMKGNTFLSILDEKHQYWMKRNTFYQNTNLYSNIGRKEHILSKSTLVHLQHWMKGNTFLSRYTILCLQYWMKWDTFYQNTPLYPINIGWKASILDEKKHIFIKIHICAPILDEKNTFYQNIHLYTLNITWKKHILSKYKFVLQYWMKRTHFIKIYICTPSTMDERNTFLSKYTFGSHSILDEKHQYWMKRDTFYQNTNLYSNIEWKEHILSKYTFVHHQHWMKWNTFYQNTLLYPINIGWTASILDEKHRYWMKRNTFYQNISLYTFNIGWKETHFIKITFVHNIGWKASILDEKHRYWMKRNTFYQNIHLYTTPILDEKNTFYQNIHLFTFNIGWKETHFYQSTQLHAFNIAPKETHFIKIPMYTFKWKEHILSKYTFVHLEYWMKKKHLSKYKFVLQYPMKRTHFIKICICTPSTLDERKHIFIKIHNSVPPILDEMKNFINIHFCILSILDEKKHILSKYKFVLQYWMKRTHFIKIYICTPSTLDERKHILSKYTFVSILDEKPHIKIQICINIGWKETHFIKI